MCKYNLKKFLSSEMRKPKIIKVKENICKCYSDKFERMRLVISFSFVICSHLAPARFPVATFPTQLKAQSALDAAPGTVGALFPFIFVSRLINKKSTRLKIFAEEKIRSFGYFVALRLQGSVC